MSQVKTFATTGASAPPRGHYSHATAAGGFVFTSGQLPIPPDGNLDPQMSFGDQARLTLANVKAALAAAGARLEDVVKVNVYVTSMENWAEFNAIYAQVFGAHRPARAVVPVAPLHYGFGLEVEAVAYVGERS
jgi:reactive intermediate/imine deaminase